jgi:hypothetical protein
MLLILPALLPTLLLPNQNLAHHSYEKASAEAAITE